MFLESAARRIARSKVKSRRFGALAGHGAKSPRRRLDEGTVQKLSTAISLVEESHFIDYNPSQPVRKVGIPNGRETKQAIQRTRRKK
jgi:hypothetical protein